MINDHVIICFGLMATLLKGWVERKMMMVCIIIVIAALLIGIFAGWTICDIKRDDREKDEKKNSNKVFTFYMLFNHWLWMKQNGKDFIAFFRDNDIKCVAIYGMKELGERLLNELDRSDVSVLYGIDRNKAEIYSTIDIKTLDEELPAVDAVVVTAITYFEEIKKTLENKINCPIISLSDVVYYEPKQ